MTLDIFRQLDPDFSIKFKKKKKYEK